jgi:starch-binding outer membrane protein, SusD/RagB family
MQRLNKFVKACLAATILFLGGCAKQVDIPAPKNQIADENVFNNNETAISVLTGIYTDMSKDGDFTGLRSMTVYTALAADELVIDEGRGYDTHMDYYRNSLSVNSNSGSELWGPLYNYVYRCNAALEGLEFASSLTPTIRQDLIGEAKFLRAFFYFYLTNLFGDVPLSTTTDYKKNSLLSRSPQSAVYDLIIKDLKEASEMLSAEYLDGSLQPYSGLSERLRPTKSAAKAMLARVYLYHSDYASAEEEASTVINNTIAFSLSTLPETFLMNSTEAIWQLQPVILGHNSEDAWVFNVPSNGLDDTHPVYLNDQLLNSFETGDERRKNWIDSVSVLGTTYYYPFKYKSATLNEPVTEYLMVLRLAELYLIRAEARTQLNDIVGAQSDLNIIRTRANLPNTTSTDPELMMLAIQHERQVELFTEWGHRWLDLKRSHTIDAVMNRNSTESKRNELAVIPAAVSFAFNRHSIQSQSGTKYWLLKTTKNFH